jgi:hypothetical protein
MKSMVITEFAMFLHLDAIRLLTFVFGCGIVALFALGAR